MKRRFVMLALAGAAACSAMAQPAVTGRWQAVVLMPDGGRQDLTLELEAAGQAVTGTVMRMPIREGRLDANTVTLSVAKPGSQGRAVSLVGQLNGDEIVFKATGLLPAPVHFVARRDAQAGMTGSVSDPAVVQPLLKELGVPGVSIAVIQDFKVALATCAYGIADADTGAPVSTDTLFQAASISKPVAAMVSLKAVQDGRFSLDQDVNTDPEIVEAPRRVRSPRTQPRHAAGALMSHTSGTGDAFGFPGYAAEGAAPDGRADPRRRRNRPRTSGPFDLERPPLTGCRVFGWRGADSAAGLDRRRRQAVRADRARVGARRPSA